LEVFIKTLLASDHFKERDFPLYLAIRDPQPEFERHKHQFYELVLVTRGSGQHKIFDRSYPLREGDIFIIEPEKDHEIQLPQNLSLINVIFDPDSLHIDKFFTSEILGLRAFLHLEPEYRANKDLACRLQLNKLEMNEAISIIDDMKIEFSMKDDAYKAATLSLFIKLLVFISRCYEYYIQPESQSLIKVANAISYLEKNFTIPISLETLSRKAHLSIRQFQRVFLQSLGCTPREYHIRLRLEYSKTLLRESESTITEIAFMSGFNDGNYFSRQFKKNFHISPSVYRSRYLKMLRQNPDNP